MTEDVILVLFLIIVGLAYVYYMKKVKAPGPGNVQGRLAKWLAGWTSAGTKKQDATTASASSTSAYYNELMKGLDEIYAEFTKETAALRKETAERLENMKEELLADMRAEIAKAVEQEWMLRNSDGPSEVCTALSISGRNVGPEAMSDLPQEHDLPPRFPGTDSSTSTGENPPEHTMDSRHFEILDSLYQGMNPEEIALSLQVDVEEVQKVRALLQTPPHHSVL